MHDWFDHLLANITRNFTALVETDFSFEARRTTFICSVMSSDEEYCLRCARDAGVLWQYNGLFQITALQAMQFCGWHELQRDFDPKKIFD